MNLLQIRVVLLTILIISGCTPPLGTQKVVDTSGPKPKWLTGPISWEKKGFFYTIGSATGVFDRSTGQRQSLLNAYSNLVMAIEVGVRTEMQSTLVGDNRSGAGMQQLFQSTDALVANNIKVLGALIDNSYFEVVATKTGSHNTSYKYNCYTLLKMDLAKYHQLMRTANALPKYSADELLKRLDSTLDRLNEDY